MAGHLKKLEAESIYILRETAAQFEQPVLLYSIGKDFHRPAASRGQGIPSGENTVSTDAR